MSDEEAQEKETKLQKAKRTLKAPATLGACLDKLYELREKRLALQSQAEELGVTYSALEDHVFKKFKHADVEGASGKAATASIQPKTVGRIEDKDKLEAYVARTKQWDLVTVMINNKAYRERLKAKKTVPGVVPFEFKKLSLTARRTAAAASLKRKK